MALEKAIITRVKTGDRVSVMFNPEEYSLNLGNNFAEIGIPGLSAPPIQYVSGNIRNLKMDLFFDTYELKEDVRNEISKVTSLLDKESLTKAPPILLFSWGGLNFKCVLETAAQRFTMFLEDGTPVRANLSVSFKEYKPVKIEIKSGFFIGPPSVHNIIDGENINNIANDILGDPGAWRSIADENNIDNPRKLKAGQKIVVSSKTVKGAED